MASTRRRIASLSALLALAVLAPGCGNDEEPPSAGRTVGSSPVPRVVDPGQATTEPPTTTTTEPSPPDRPPELPAEPVAIAELLVAAELAVRDPSTPEVELAEQAHITQYVYRVLAANPDWDSVVRETVPPELHHALDANIAARRELRSMHTHLLETLPAWRIIDPIPYDELLGYYSEAEAEFGVPWEYLAAIHLVETAIGRVDGISVAGAQGPMQFMPGTWEAFGNGGDVRDHRDAIHGAARYLRHSGAPGDMPAALFAYNRHYAYVRAIQHFASVIRDDPLAFRGYYHWQVYVLTAFGDVVMPVGYEEHERIPVEEYLARLDG
jgi:soluble lytic murein transglycosylase-like protein